MNTHIIIPTEGISGNELSMLYSIFKDRIKQISLEKKDIEELALAKALDKYSEKRNPLMKFTARIAQRLGYYNGYMDALKKLI